jgi:hypothetical protein
MKNSVYIDLHGIYIIIHIISLMHYTGININMIYDTFNVGGLQLGTHNKFWNPVLEIFEQSQRQALSCLLRHFKIPVTDTIHRNILMPSNRYHTESSDLNARPPKRDTCSIAPYAIH